MTVLPCMQVTAKVIRTGDISQFTKKVAVIRSNGCPTIANKCRQDYRCECMSHLSHYWKKDLRNFFRIKRIQTHDLCVRGAMFTQLSYRSHVRMHGTV